jgi:D-alanyl-D-alanine carboxypeptidase
MKKALILVFGFLTSLISLVKGQNSDLIAPMLDFAEKQPEDIAIIGLKINADNTVSTTLSWNAQQPMPLASSRKIVVLAAYAQAISAKILEPNAPVKLSEWEAYYLPGLDGGAHMGSLNALKIPADMHGRAKDQNATVPLDTLARFMIETSDNAATDLILTRLGPDAIPQTIRALELTGQEDFGPLCGVGNAWFDPSINGQYQNLPLQTRVADSWKRAEEIRTNPALRDPKTIQKASIVLGLSKQKELANTTDTHGTVQDYANLMVRVMTGKEFNPTELEIMRRHLGWPFRVNPKNHEVYENLYAKGGSLLGVLTDNLGINPKFEPYAGQQHVVSMFLRNIPDGQYNRIAQSLEHGMMRLTYKPDQATRLMAVLKP